MNIPEELKYTETHEWVRIEKDIVTVGITDHAQDELTDIVFVELPSMGKTLEAGETAAVVESHKAASDVYAPVTGEVIEINEDLEEDPGAINTSPYQDGWIFKLKMTDGAESEELETLLDAASYKEQIK